MSRESIKKLLSDDVVNLIDSIDVVDEIDSTNAELARQARNGKSGTRLLLARAQTAGRGRRGRNWSSPHSGGIYLSLSRPVSGDQSEIAGLSLVAAISVLSVMQELGANTVQLKWPNDILVGKQKLAGLLLEMVAAPSLATIIFGIGVNLSLSKEVRKEIGRPVIGLADVLGGESESESGIASESEREIESEIDSDAVVVNIVESLLSNVQEFEEKGFANFQETWNAHDRYINQDIVIQDGNRQMIGRSLGVDTDGALILQTASGRERISGGEIFPSLRELSEASDS